MTEYQVGGSLNVNSSTYVTRNADEQLYQALRKGEFCYVFNCRQMGKSSLRVRSKNRLEQQGYACVSLDMTNIGVRAIAPMQWYKSLVSEIWRGFDLMGKVSLKSWWQEHSELSPIQHLNLFVSDVVLSFIEAEKVFIFIDEIDSILGLDFATDDFFALIRYFYNARAENPKFERLSFALFGVATPSELIEDYSRTPFNIGTAIELTGFTLTEARPLVNGLQNRFQNCEIILKEILYWTGGQPFLTQKLCKLVADSSQASSCCPLPGYDIEWIKTIVLDKIIINWESKDEPEHLKTICDRLLRDEQTANLLLRLTEQILIQGSIQTDDSLEQRLLLLTNLVIKSNNRLIIRNPIYQQIFNLDWVYQQSDKLCPYSREIKFWLASNCQDRSRLLRGQALRDARTWANNHNISQAEYQFLNASQEQEQAEIRQALEFKRLREVETRLIQEQKLAKTQGFLLSTVGAALFMTSILSLTAYSNYQQARNNEIQAENSKLEARIVSAESLFDSEQRFASLVQAIEAKQDISELGQIDPAFKSDVDLALEQAVYNVVEKNTFSGHIDVVNSVSYSRNGKLIASASSDNTVKIWQKNGKLRHTLKGHQDSVIDVAFSPTKDLIVSASEDNTVKLWSVTGKLKHTLSGHRGSVHRVVFSPTGDLFASASEDRTVRLWNIKGGLVNVLTGNQTEVLALAFSPDGQIIATGDRSGTIGLWNRSGEVLDTFIAHKLPVRGIDFSPDGQRLVTGGDDNQAKIWQLDGTLVKILQGYEAPVTGVKFSPDGKIIATSSWDKSVKLWYPDGTLYSQLQGHQGRVWRLAWSPDGSTIATAGWDNVVKLWQIKDPLVLTFYGHSASILSVAFHPQGKLIATTADDRTVKLWHLDGTLETNFTQHNAETYEVTFSPDGELVASASLDRTIKLWRPNGNLLYTVFGHDAPVVDVDFMSDGITFISSGHDRKIRFWELKKSGDRIEAVPKKTIFAHQAIIADVDISSDGKLIASVSHDRYLKLWQPNGKLIRAILADDTGLRTVAISPDSQIIATAGKEKNIKFWNLEGKLIKTIRGHSAAVLDLEFSPDGSKIASASADHKIKIWNKRGKLLTTLRGHSGRVWNIEFSPNGQQLVSGAEDKLVKLWHLDRILRLDPLEYGCNWIEDYLRTNPDIQEQDDICSFLAFD
ncbi:MAG: AAA-like domain-containing protein [Pleurocapsa sp. MO_226.B13]|nr:AAA-like domain-containing protein [Pleurocapsa sp. MO_226.B13]